MSETKVVKECILQYGSEHMLPTAVAPVGAGPMREIIRLGPSACLNDVSCMSLHPHIMQCPSLDQAHNPYLDL